MPFRAPFLGSLSPDTVLGSLGSFTQHGCAAPPAAREGCTIQHELCVPDPGGPQVCRWLQTRDANFTNSDESRGSVTILAVQVKGSHVHPCAVAAGIPRLGDILHQGAPESKL